MRLLIAVVALLAITATACNKKDRKDFKAAYIINSGDITNEGCGYIIRLDNGNEEKPDNLPTAFRLDSLRVLVKYHPSGRLDTCGYATSPIVYKTVLVDDIQREKL